MNEQRRQILQMLSDGKITADEAERLISALERAEPEPPPAVDTRKNARPKYLRVLVSWDEEATGEGPGRINIRVPLQLLRAGVRLTSLIPPLALTKINTELEKSGVPLDLAELKPQDLEEIIDQLGDVIVDVDDPGSKVRVFCE
ncbi:hypothetical protein J4573_17745 [Actinomadura barringtoniae]|uniref:YvlB/LiaX N-terminal domain-containing protein n=1 Tax=Actinomadura barringtoniae TaxID=1427535 RepID=A0A939PI37_9ACTN|nr:hypothetical protein [Actinomadura barringtoniae]MBO2448951.1 hypothetical protein [Actinomadura barringtoniae]